ncbi:MAG: sigma 54-interacting transcriptional regulator [Firmicutes bacterium]|nr:sigma 54-interacting transcriptional regulator [Bacillota bacterium]
MYIEKYCNISGDHLEFRESFDKYRFGNILTCDRNMLDQLERIRKIAQSNATVIIFGETGTGKELYAEYIHQMSVRKDKRYIKINCATISESLFESEMFGYQPGAFTGALKGGKQGIFEIASGGTIFLDEISEMSKNNQSKFLRAIQENAFVKVGGGSETKVDVRIIAASNRELEGMVEEGEFREDLFYRLNVIPVKLTPLAERKEDIVLLSMAFMDSFNKAYGLNRRMSPQLMETLVDYRWPGNVRELKNVIERAVLLSSDDLLTRVDLKNSIKSKARQDSKTMPQGNSYFDMEHYSNLGKSLKEIMGEYEKMVITEYVRRHGSLRKAAKALQVSPASLSRKMSEYDEKE